MTTQSSDGSDDPTPHFNDVLGTCYCDCSDYIDDDGRHVCKPLIVLVAHRTRNRRSA